jgi:hypothetical protein
VTFDHQRCNPATPLEVRITCGANTTAAISWISRGVPFLPKHLTDEVMNRVVPQGAYAEIPTIPTEWYSGLCTGLRLPVPADDEHDDHVTEVERCKAIPTSGEPVPF